MNPTGLGGALCYVLLLVDLVTEWDVKVEELVKAEISKAYPTFQL